MKGGGGMNTLTLTVELCAEDRARLDAIITALQNVGTPFQAPVVPVAHESAPETRETPAPVTDTPEPEPPAQDAQDAQDGAETQHATRGMVQDLVITLASWGHKAEAREIVQRFAQRVSAIPDGDLDTVFTELDKVRRAHEGEN